MRKYKIYNSEKEIIDEFVCSNLINEKFLKLRYENHNIYTSCCFTEGNEALKIQFFLEIKKETDSYLDLLDIKEETIRVVDFIANEFDIKVEYIRIYFNGINGFCIVVQNVALGLYYMGRNDIYLRINHVVKYIKEKTKCEDIVTDNYAIDLMHLEFETLHINTKLYTHRISRDNLERFNVNELLSYFRDIQREGFGFGVRDHRNEPEGKFKEVLESYNPLYPEEELANSKKSFFNLDTSKDLNTSENLEVFKMKIANDANYNEGNNFLLYMYNTMINEANNYPRQEVSSFKIAWIKKIIIDFLAMTNEDKGLGAIEDHTNYYIFKRINGATEYIMQLHISNSLVEDNERTISVFYDNTKVNGRYKIPESQFGFESLITILSNIDFILNGQAL